MRFIINFLIVGLSATMLSLSDGNELSFEMQVHNWFVNGLDDYSQSVSHLRNLVAKGDTAQWQSAFADIRKSYKRLSFLSDRLFPYETLQWNAPNLPRVEDDHPESVISPQGMQLLEVLLFDQVLKNADTERILQQLGICADVAAQIKVSSSPIMFKQSSLWQALRDGWITIVTKGITGFESPVAGLSLQESGWQLEGMYELMQLLTPFVYHDEKELWQQALAKCGNAVAELSRTDDFDNFDRLQFIRNAMVPLAVSLEEIARLPSFAQPNERQPLYKGQVNIFTNQPFDIAFFAPNDRYLPTTQRVMLGKKLFDDQRLSGNNQQSCAGCHQPERGFTDGLPKAIGLDGKSVLLRNTPSVWNAGFQTRQFYDMRQSLLDFQVGNVVHSTDEMGGSMQDAVAKLLQDNAMVEAFRQAYPTENEAIAVHTLSNAIASYIRSLSAFRSPVNDYINGDSPTINPLIAKGFNLFTGKAGCATCHFLPAYNGLVPPRFQETEAEILGVPSLADSKNLDDDLGKYNFTKAAIHRHAFKTPGLYNVALTAPYMHNGVFATLEEVIEFYNDGGGAGRGLSVSHQTLPSAKLNLSESEKTALILFLQSLSDTSALHHLP